MYGKVKGNKGSIGPYPLMCLSERDCPCLEDIGIGIGCLKVKGNTNFSEPLCPAAIVLPKGKDPIRRSWRPHTRSPVEPPVEYCEALELVERSWYPHKLISEYVLKGKKLSQTSYVYRYGARTRIRFESGLNDFLLSGVSRGTCKLWFDAGVLHVIETLAALRPLSYKIRFSTAPDRIDVIPPADGDTLEELAVYDASCEWRFRWHRSPTELVIDVEVLRDQYEAHATPIDQDFDSGLQNLEQEWERYFLSSVPRLTTPDERINRLNDYLSYVYRSNGMYLGGILSHPFTMPKQTFYGYWMWDSCFHAIAGRWYKDRELVWGNILNIENLQYPTGLRAAGVVTNSADSAGVDVFISDEAMAERLLLLPHRIPQKHGDGTHPPVLAQALEAVWLTDGNDRNLRRLLPNAIAYHAWFERRRRSERFPGLLLVRRWSDSGMDNSKRWGHQGSGIYCTSLDESGWSMPIVAVDLNVLSILEKQSLSRILDYLDREEEAAEFLAQAEERTHLVHDTLWNKERGFYCDRDEMQGRYIPVLAPTGFYPMLLEGLSEKRLQRLLDHLFNTQEFWANAPLPSLSMNDPNFGAEQSYWMGCTWMNYNYYILRALFRHSPDSGGKLFDRILSFLVPEGVPAIFENYNPLTGQGYDAANFGWAGLLVDVIIQDLLGIRVGAETPVIGEIRCPLNWPRWELSNLYYRGRLWNISAIRRGGGWKTEISCVEKTR